MGRITRYLEIVPIWMLLVLPLVAMTVVFLTPRKWRLSFAIVFAILWLTFGKMMDMPLLQALSKATTIVAHIAVALAAHFHPGPRRRLAPICWLYVAMAIISPIYILTTLDRDITLILRLNWFMLVLAALLVVRTITDDASLRYIINAITLGAALATFFVFTALIQDPAAAIRHGKGRLGAYGSSSNHIGPLFCLTAPLCLYAAMKTKNMIVKWGSIGFATIAIGLSVLTASRSVVFVIAIPLLPMLIALTKRPIFTVLAVGIVLLSLGWFLGEGVGGDVNVGRLGSLESGRYALWGAYIQNLLERSSFSILFGLLFSHGQYANLDPELNWYPHNSFLLMMHTGGFSYWVPMMFLVVYSAGCTIYTWIHRKMLSNDPLLISTLAAFLAAIYAHAMVVEMIYGHGNPWALFHIILASLFMTVAGDLRASINRQALASSSP